MNDKPEVADAKPAPKKAAASKASAASEPSADVRAAAVLCGLSYDEFLKEFGEGKAAAVLEARGRV
jgi:hypothetical protein